MPGDPPTELEQRAARLGIAFLRGRTVTSNSHLALEAAEFVADVAPHLAGPFHRAVFRTYFEELGDIGAVAPVVAAAESAGLDGKRLGGALSQGTYRERVDDGIRWSAGIGVNAVPTFVFDGRHGIVGAQDFSVLEGMMRRLGRSPRS